MGINDKVKQAKKWYGSKTIVAIVVSAIGMVLKMKFDVDIESIIDSIWGVADEVSASGDNIVFLIQELVILLAAVFGRVKAKVGIEKSLM